MKAKLTFYLHNGEYVLIRRGCRHVMSGRSLDRFREFYDVTLVEGPAPEVEKRPVPVSIHGHGRDPNWTGD